MPIDPELAKWFASLGVGGTLAFIVWWYARRDSKEWLEYVKAQKEGAEKREERALAVVSGNAVAANELAQEIRHLSTILKEEGESRRTEIEKIREREEKRQDEMIAVIKQATRRR